MLIGNHVTYMIYECSLKQCKAFLYYHWVDTSKAQGYVALLFDDAPVKHLVPLSWVDECT